MIKKQKALPAPLLRTHSIIKIERWHIAQKIGKEFYNSELNLDELLQSLEHFKQYGVLKK